MTKGGFLFLLSIPFSRLATSVFPLVQAAGTRGLVQHPLVIIRHERNDDNESARAGFNAFGVCLRDGAGVGSVG